MDERPSPTSTPPPEEGPRRRGGGQKRKSTGLSNSSVKRLARERAALPPLHNGPTTRARQSPNKAAAAAAAAAGSPAKPPPPGPSPLGLPAPEPILMVAESPKPPQTPAFDSEFEAFKSRDRSAHVIPAHAGWYSWTKVHSIEERAMPSFFDGKVEERSPEIYIEIRNAIMKKFHDDPHKNIEPKTLELSVGNSDARQEIMEFLDYWGLINFHPFPPIELTESKNDVDESCKSSPLVQKLYKFEVVHTPQSELSYPSLTTPAPLQLLPDSFIFEDLAKADGVEYHCNSCSGDCSRKRYHCQKQADFDLCTECYGEGKFGSGMTSADFILMEPAEGPGTSGGNWTDQETLLLLEALELFGENWNEIAEHVATKTRTQCMLHFIQMPIEDPFLDEKGDIDVEIQDKTKSGATHKVLSTPDITSPEEVLPAVVKEQSVPSSTDVPKAKDASHETPVAVVEEMEKDSAEEVKDLAGEKDDNANAVNGNDEAGKKVKDATDEVPRGEDMQMDIIEGTLEDATVLLENILDNNVNPVLDALKAAFEVGGPFLQPDEGSYSFSNASNPVMTLVAFLAGLVKPDNGAAAAYSSLKAVSEASPSLQLASRHCLILDDPPDYEKVHNACESSASDSVDQVNDKVVRFDDPSSSASRSDENEDTTKDPLPAKKKDTLPSLQEQSEKDQCVEKDTIEKPVSESSDPSQVQIKSILSNGDRPNEDTEESGDAALPTDATKDVDAQIMDSVSHKQEKEGAVADESDVVRHKEEQCAESSMSIKVDMPSVSPEKNDSQLLDVSIKAVQVEGATASGIDNGAKTTKGGMDGRVMNGVNEQSSTSDRLKRAALTTLSASAVKAKFLADQQEDQILELVALLIEKQLHKLEIKLSLYMEMDAAIVRSKEQIERARQRLYNERSQIIAYRLGLPASSARPVSSSLLPPGRTGTNYPIMSMMRPQLNTALRGLAPTVPGPPRHNTPYAGNLHPA